MSPQMCPVEHPDFLNSTQSSNVSRKQGYTRFSETSLCRSGAAGRLQAENVGHSGNLPTTHPPAHHPPTHPPKSQPPRLTPVFFSSTMPWARIWRAVCRCSGDPISVGLRRLQGCRLAGSKWPSLQPGNERKEGVCIGQDLTRNGRRQQRQRQQRQRQRQQRQLT